MAISTVYCNECGTANPAQAKFCLGCGHPLPTSPSHTPSTQGPTLPTGTLPPNHMLKQRYRILHQIGQGGMGAVYKAEDTHFNNRAVAVKEMSQSGLRPQEVHVATEAFKHEAMLLASLMHPHLPRIYDHFSEDGRWYLVMDFIEGETLEEFLHKLSGGSLPLDQVLAIGIQLCTVLGYLHTRQPPIIFRDLKPANIMITPEENLYLIDFGIARHFKPGQVRDTSSLGSVGYAAPEQYGQAQTTARSDIYSLGATLHQLLSGNVPAQTPFRFASLRRGNQTIPVELESLLMQMVDIDESKRPPSMAVVKQELQHIAMQRQTRTAQTTGGVTRELSLSVNNSPSLGSTLLTYRGHTERVLAVSWSPDGRYIASGGYDKTVQVWDAQTGNRLLSYPGHTEWVHAVAWSPDGKYLASAGADTTVHLWDALTGHTALIYRGHTNIVSSISWSPDGRQMVSGGYDKTVQVWQAVTSDKLFTYRGHNELVNAVAWSPDGKYIATAGDDKTVQLWNVATKRALYTYRGHTGWVKALAWSPNGTRIASGAWDDTVQVWDTLTGNYVFTHRDHSSWVNAVAWSPISARIASASNDKTVQLWHASNGRELFPKRKPFTYNGHSEWVRAVAWSPDGTRVASGGHDATVRVWQAM